MGMKLNFKRFLIIGFISYVAYIFVQQQLTINRINNSILSAKDEINKVNSENEKLQDKLDSSKSDAYLEKLARERGLLIKKGEIPVLEKK